MSAPSSNRPRSVVAAVGLLILASLVLAACGGSSSTSSTSASTNASATTSTPNGTPGAPGGHFAALRECLQKNGITLPQRTPGKRPSGGGFLGAGGGGASLKLPSGVTRAQYEAAIKKCGGFPGRFGAGAGGGGAARFRSPAFKAAIAKFATCMDENGVKVPTPNTSGNGPIFDTKGVNVKSAQFKAAETKCSQILRSSFSARPGAVAPPSAG